MTKLIVIEGPRGCGKTQMAIGMIKQFDAEGKTAIHFDVRNLEPLESLRGSTIDYVIVENEENNEFATQITTDLIMAGILSFSSPMQFIGIKERKTIVEL